ncbi:MAG: metalloregulator ArsR/SmtB family transcription factor [Lentimicrobiaceae bacterium]|nr:metalloregulator ArsR/SmtB family transcription factor [Lentimicrobiaceae bacterium]
MKGKNKLDIEKLQVAADKIKSLAHPVRIAIVELIIEHKQLNVTQIYTKLNLQQAVASHHLGLLRSRGLLETERKGREIIYKVKDDLLFDIIECINKCGD